jgi:uncharacterized protein (TIGR02145 family)
MNRVAILLAAVLALGSCQDSNPASAPEAGLPVRIDLTMGSDLPDSTKESTDSISVTISVTDGTVRRVGWRPGRDSTPRWLLPTDLGFDATASGYDSAGNELWHATTSVAGQTSSDGAPPVVILVAHRPAGEPAPEMIGAVNPVVASHEPGAYTRPIRLVLSTTTTSAVVRYTTDGSTPDANSPVFSDSLWIDSSVTLRAVATRAGHFPSEPRTLRYRLVADSLATSHPDTTDDTPFLLQLACSSPGAIIRYRLDGVVPDSSSPVFPAALILNAPNNHILARAFAPGLEPGPVHEQTIRIALPPPSWQAVTRVDGTLRLELFHPDSSTRIHYSMDGTAPDTTSPRATSEIVIDRNLRLRAFAWSPTLGTSPELDTTFRFVPHPGYASHPSGTYDRILPVVFPGATPGSVVRYTTDGSQPTRESPRLPDTVWIRKPTRIRYQAFRDGWSEMSGPWEATWKLVASEYTWSTAPGLVYRKGRLTVSTAGTPARLTATTDGSAPTPDSPPHEGTFILDSASTRDGLRVRILATVSGAESSIANTMEGTWTWAGGEFVDPRDGNHYRTIRSLNGEWMATDLRFASEDSFPCFPDSSGGCGAGRFYTASEATSSTKSCVGSLCDPPQGVCPDGWHLPSPAEWQEMIGLQMALDKGTWDVRASLGSVGAWSPTGEHTLETGDLRWSWQVWNGERVPTGSVAGGPVHLERYGLPVRCVR